MYAARSTAFVDQQTCFAPLLVTSNANEGSAVVDPLQDPRVVAEIVHLGGPLAITKGGKYSKAPRASQQSN
jgi:hypothetical protein